MPKTKETVSIVKTNLDNVTFQSMLLKTRYVKIMNVKIGNRNLKVLRLSSNGVKIFNRLFGTKLVELQTNVFNTTKKNNEIWQQVETKHISDFIKNSQDVNYNSLDSFAKVIDTQNFIQNRDLFLTFINELKQVELDNSKKNSVSA